MAATSQDARYARGQDPDRYGNKLKLQHKTTRPTCVLVAVSVALRDHRRSVPHRALEAAGHVQRQMRHHDRDVILPFKCSAEPRHLVGSLAIRLNHGGVVRNEGRREQRIKPPVLVLSENTIAQAEDAACCFPCHCTRGGYGKQQRQLSSAVHRPTIGQFPCDDGPRSCRLHYVFMVPFSTSFERAQPRSFLLVILITKWSPIY